jgi:hypothetical protein
LLIFDPALFPSRRGGVRVAICGLIRVIHISTGTTISIVQ